MRWLDTRRLGKQRVEALQVLRALTVPGYGWSRHPAVLVWAGYEEALVRYGLEICDAWCAVGRADTCANSLRNDLAAACGIKVVRTEVVRIRTATGRCSVRSRPTYRVSGPSRTANPGCDRNREQT